MWEREVPAAPSACSAPAAPVSRIRSKLSLETVMAKLVLLTIAVVSLVAGPARADPTQELFDKKCAGCHGVDGKGDTKMGHKFHAPDFTSPKWKTDTTDAEIVKTILNGVVKDGVTR